MELAHRIRNIRKAYKLTQQDVAFSSNMTPSAYGQIERKASQSTYYTLDKISNAMGVSLKFLIDIENDNFIEEKYKI